MNKISMPKACISCDHYQHKGRKKDVVCPYGGKWDKVERTQYGKCTKNECDVFATQLCSSHTYPSDLIDVHEVPNRTFSLEPMQTSLV